MNQNELQEKPVNEKKKVKKSKIYFLLQTLFLLFNFLCEQDDATFLKITFSYHFNCYVVYVCEMCKNVSYVTWFIVNFVCYASWNDVNWASMFIFKKYCFMYWV